jgi:hypothetical protein
LQPRSTVYACAASESAQVSQVVVQHERVGVAARCVGPSS